MKVKRLISLLAAVALVTMSLSTVGVSAKTVTDNTTLRWDFESTDDFAPLDRGLSNFGYVGTHPDTIGSGAWSRQIVDAWPADGAPFQTTFDRIYTVNSETDNNVSPWPYIDPSATSSAFTSQPLEDGGDHCAVINSSTGTAGRTVGMCIMLSDTEFVPGHTYKVSADLFSASADRMVYMGLSKPSERTTAATKANPVWMTTANQRTALSTAYDPVAPKENGCAGNDTWRMGTGYITPTADMYEDGKILFYIGGGDLGDTHSQLPKNECLYIDNVEITPQHAFAGYSSLKRGRIWDFEEGADKESFTTVLGAYDDSGKAIDSVNEWGPIARDTLNTTTQAPRYIKVSEATDRIYGRWSNNDLPSEGYVSKGYAGTPASGSDECIYVKTRAIDGSWDGGVYSLGVRVVLSQDEFPAGTYRLGFYGAYTGNEDSSAVGTSRPLTSSKWKVAVIPTSAPGIWYTYPNGEADCLKNATFTKQSELRCGNFWSYNTIDVTLTEDAYTDGTTSLILYINRGSDNMRGGAAIFLDDIALTPVDDGSYVIPNDGTAVNGYMTTVVSETSKKPAAYIAAYDTNDNGDVVLTDIDVFAPKTGITNYQFSVVPSTNPWGWPYIKSFLFDENLLPLSKNGIIGE